VAKKYYYDVVPSSQGWSNTPANPKGMLVATSSGTSGSTLAQTEYSYDLMGNVLAMWQCGPSICGTSSQSSRTLQFAYDLGNHVTMESDPASGTIAYGRSPAGEVTSITNESYEVSNNTGTASLVSNVVNGPFGPSLYTLGNGLNTIQTYDALGRKVSVWVCSGSITVGCQGGGVTLYGNTVTFRGIQAISSCDTIVNQCQTNTYDAMNRLTALNGSTNSFTYTYDRWGNRLSQTAILGSGSSPSGAVNAATNQLVSVAYDAAGNQEGDGIAHTFTYDAEGNVTAVDNGSTATYVYDALNHRVETAASAGTYEYSYDAMGRRISTWQASNNFGIEGRMYWGRKQIAFRNGPTFFEHQSYLGTERTRTSYQGAVATTEVSLSYGDDLNQSVLVAGADQDNNQFAGQEHDAESGSEHAQFRQYSSTQGRWMSPDPYDGSYKLSDPQSLNRYSYARNNPLNSVDPLGLMIDQTGSDTGGGGGGTGWDPLGLDPPPGNDPGGCTDGLDGGCGNDPSGPCNGDPTGCAPPPPPPPAPTPDIPDPTIPTNSGGQAGGGAGGGGAPSSIAAATQVGPAQFPPLCRQMCTATYKACIIAAGQAWGAQNSPASGVDFENTWPNIIWIATTGLPRPDKQSCTNNYMACYAQTCNSPTVAPGH